MQKALLFLGGEFQGDDLARQLVESASIVVCADSGAHHAHRLGIQPNTIIGDLDSIDRSVLEQYSSGSVEIIQVSEQEHNDFEKALAWLVEKKYSVVDIFGMTGRRSDHTLTNFSVMLRYASKFERLFAHDSFGYHQFILPSQGEKRIECDTGTTISLTPFGSARGIRTANLRYPLHAEALELGVREGLSNVATASTLTISLESGALLVSVLRK